MCLCCCCCCPHWDVLKIIVLFTKVHPIIPSRCCIAQNVTGRYSVIYCLSFITPSNSTSWLKSLRLVIYCGVGFVMFIPWQWYQMKVSQSVLRAHTMIICIFTMTYKILQSGQPNSMQNSQFYVSLPVESYCTSSYIFFPIWYNSRYSRTASAKNQEPILRSTNPWVQTHQHLFSLFTSRKINSHLQTTSTNPVLVTSFSLPKNRTQTW